jgi:23S rRNA pseudouridine2605 synthase
MVPMRLAKFLAHAGVASRRGAEEIVRAGRVTVAGEVVTDPARDVEEGVAVDGRPVSEEALVVYAVNKPPGYVSTAEDTHGRAIVTDLVDDPRRLYPVGRLDVDTTGLLLLTNDGALAHRLLHPRYEVPRTYRVWVAKPPVRGPTLKRLAQGMELDDGVTLPAGVRRVRPDVLELTLREGRKRQVRRMCEAVGHPVRALERIAFGSLRLSGLAPGTARRLTPAELAELRRL